MAAPASSSPPGPPSVLSPDGAELKAAAFKALSDPVRLRLLSLIANAPTGEVCACDLPEAVARSQPTVSHHLAILTEAGWVTRTQRGRWAWFRVAPARSSLVHLVMEGFAESAAEAPEVPQGSLTQSSSL